MNSEMSAQQQQLHARKKGGLVTMPFIIANEAFEKVSSYGLLPNMILYLMKDYGMELAKGTHVLFIWSAATNFMPLVGAFIADSYLGRFLTIGLGSMASLLGMILLWLTTMIPQLKSPSCHSMITGCNSASQLAFLFISFALMSIGAGGIRSCSLAFGADQLDKQQSSTTRNKRVLESYFGWYYASASVSVLIALTGIVYIQDHLGWKIGFGVPALLMFLSASLFFMASSLYVKQQASSNLIVDFAQVIVASYRKRAIPYPSSDEFYQHEKGSEFLVPTDNLRFLNKACLIVTNLEEEMTSDCVTLNDVQRTCTGRSCIERTCTVKQVEQLKILLRVLPIWSTGIMMSVNTSQSTFQFMQANSMDRHITRSFQIPAGSFGMFLIFSLAAWVVLYDRIILPLASKLQGKPVRIGVKARMGIGLFLSSLAMVVSATVEHIRRRKAVDLQVTMSAMWLIPQYVIQGLAEAFNAIAQTEFYYSEFPKNMSSIAAALFGLGMAVASLLASAILSLVDGVTSRNGHTSWASSDINKGHFDWYYWVLAALSFANIGYFIICSLAYGPCLEDQTKTEDLKSEEELSPMGMGQVDNQKIYLVRHQGTC